jgi:hypothetical protein
LGAFFTAADQGKVVCIIPPSATSNSGGLLK